MQQHPVEQPGSWLFPAVRYVVGALLVAAGGLKLYGLGVSAVPAVGPWSAPAVQSAAVVWELVLGAWLLSGAAARVAWVAAVGTFLVFAGISSYLGWIGVATCGCFGTVPASPWVAFGVDVAALVLLAFARPPSAVTPGEGRRVAVRFAGVLLGAGLVLAAFAALGGWMYGSPKAALHRLRGERVTVDSPYLDFGEVRPGQSAEAWAAVRNWSDRPIRLIGGTSDCSCVTTADLPLTVPPGEVVSVRVRLKLPESSPGAFTRAVSLWTDDDTQRSVGFGIGCRVP